MMIAAVMENRAGENGEGKILTSPKLNFRYPLTHLHRRMFVVVMVAPAGNSIIVGSAVGSRRKEGVRYSRGSNGGN